MTTLVKNSNVKKKNDCKMDTILSKHDVQRVVYSIKARFEFKGQEFIQNMTSSIF